MTERQADIRFAIALLLIAAIFQGYLQGASSLSPGEYFSFRELAKVGGYGSLIMVAAMFVVYFFDWIDPPRDTMYIKYAVYSFFGSIVLATVGWVIVYPPIRLWRAIFG